jgi:hypothetical protein
LSNVPHIGGTETQISKERNGLLGRVNVEMNLGTSDGRKWTRIVLRPKSHDRNANRDQIGVMKAERGRNIECK